MPLDSYYLVGKNNNGCDFGWFVYAITLCGYD